MRKRLIHHWLVCWVALSFTALPGPPAHGQGTGFTYQGRLDDGGTPASGLHDFRFRLFDTGSGGVPIGPIVCVDDVSLTDGVFTVQVDFGPQYATVAERHLEIDVRRDTGLNCADATGFATLTPRQQLTAAPMAVHAGSAFALDAADGSPTSAVFVDDTGQVGIGTMSPEAPLDVHGTVRWGGNATEYAYSGIDASGLYLEHKGSSIARSRVRLQSSRAGDQVNYSQFNIDPIAGFSFVALGSGNSSVGIGTTAPQARLDVRGDIRLGSTGQLHATSGEEKLRVVRGRVSSSGAVLAGSGFTASRTSTGTYAISFNPQFLSSELPIVTVSAEWVSGTAYVAMTNGVLWATAGVRITNGGGTLTDQSFSFIAVGPR